MKKFLIIALCLSLKTSQSQIIITKTRVSSNNTKDYLHLIANDFANEVGKALKEHYPSKVKDVMLSLRAVGGQLSLTYKATLLKCSTQEAQRHFDHRGALAVNMQWTASLNDATERSYRQKDQCEKEFRIVYGGCHSIPRNDYVKYKNRWWAIQEFFITEK